MLRIKDKGNPFSARFYRAAKLLKLFVRFRQPVVVRTRNTVRAYARVPCVYVSLLARERTCFAHIQALFVEEIGIVNCTARR